MISSKSDYSSTRTNKINTIAKANYTLVRSFNNSTHVSCNIKRYHMHLHLNK